ncbi:hypothetical protein [Nocardia brasiliensis]|uniref:hypothetical protein n=1 Tax=Nocardia brasiliensis TaxID=37326 RepID=UPI002455EDEF|nr:hypothetical protein [Nocardia brasiliensis]
MDISTESTLTLFDLTPCHFFAACGHWVSDAASRGPVCLQCRRSFGEYLRPVTPPPVAEADPAPPAPLTTAQRFEIAVAALRHRPPHPVPEQEQEVKRNQICWLCEDRRTCKRTPNGWECADCHE